MRQRNPLQKLFATLPLPPRRACTLYFVPIPLRVAQLLGLDTFSQTANIAFAHKLTPTNSGNGYPPIMVVVT